MHYRKLSTRSVFGLLLALTVVGIGSVLLLGKGFAPAFRKNAGTPKIVVQPAALRQQMVRPSLEGGTGWINTAGPIHLDELRGKLVLLDFWTYCCINCHHVLPDLAKLEQKYKNELVVIGVHTAKFFAERDTQNIREKVREYQIKHPVINDADQVLWTRFGVNSWPTLVLLDVDGSYAGSISGEGHYQVLDKVIGELVAKHKARGDLNETPIKFFPENEKPDNTPLLFPGKVLADKETKRLFVADTAHNRIVVASLEGKVEDVVGSGAAGLSDGTYTKAEFNRPQGMCLVGDHSLYVADTENHALRLIDLDAKTVTTLAGNGHQSHRRSGGGAGKATGLNSPWDVIQWPGKNELLIAMAGPHQIWHYDIDTRIVGVWAGSGIENIIDGPLAEAAFAQPSGLATDGSNLFIADSEVSGVRVINLKGKSHYVGRIVGVGLFGFDDVDGRGEEVRLQHCLGLAYSDSKLYIADSYNNKVKVCDPKSRAVKTLLGSREPGDSDDPPRFYQPGGLSIAGSSLYIADTNNQKIRRADLNTGKVETVELSGLEPPAPKPRVPHFPNATVTDVGSKRVAPGKSLAINVTIPIPQGMKLNKDVPLPYLVETPGKAGIISDEFPPSGGKIRTPAKMVTIDIPLAKVPEEGDKIPLKVSLSAFVCGEKSSLCTIRSFVWNVPVTFQKEGADRIELSAKTP